MFNQFFSNKHYLINKLIDCQIYLISIGQGNYRTNSNFEDSLEVVLNFHFAHKLDGLNLMLVDINFMVSGIKILKQLWHIV